MPEPNFTRFTGAAWIVQPLNKIRQWMIEDRLLKIPGMFRDTGAGWEIIPSAIVEAAATEWAFQPYFVTEDEVVKLRIREGLVSPGAVMPTLNGTALDNATPPGQSGKDTGTVAVWLLIEHDLQTESYWDVAANATRYQVAAGGDMIAATVEFTNSASTEPAGVRAGAFSNTSGAVSQTPKFAVQLCVITGGVPQEKAVSNVSTNLFIKFCPRTTYQPFPQ